MKKIYFDNSATTPAFPEAIEAVKKALETEFYNPSALYSGGIAAMDARENVRDLLVKSLSFRGTAVFTSGGTEADNLAIMGTAKKLKNEKGRFITTVMEHAAVRECFEALSRAGHEVIYLPVDSSGAISMDELREAVNENTALVSIMQVNNETGAVADIARITRLVKEKNPRTLVHTDAVQGYLRVESGAAEADLISVSGHKLHATKGIGALFIRKGLQIEPVLYGGGQESGIRSGTENMPGIMALGAAVEQFTRNQEAWRQQMFGLKTALWDRLSELDDVRLNGPAAESGAPHILNVSFKGVRSATLQQAADAAGLMISTGSACKSRGARVSQVILAHGVPNEYAQGAVRISLSPRNTMEEAEQAAVILKDCVKHLRKYVRK